MRDPLLAAGPVVLLLLCLLGCGTPPLASRWREQPIAIDGAVEDWVGLQAPAPLDRRPARVGVANDGEALYLSVATDDRELARALAFGFTLWIDPRGGKARDIGVRLLMAPPIRRNRWEWEPSPFPARLEGIELLGPQPSTRRRVDPPGEGGVEVAFAAAEGPLVFELRVPLAAAGGWGLAARPGELLGVTLEGTRPSFGPRRTADEPDREDGPRGGGRRGGGAGGGPPGRGPGGRGPRPLDLWLTVRLAAAP
jgi:hypothetical protein